MKRKKFFAVRWLTASKNAPRGTICVEARAADRARAELVADRITRDTPPC